MLTFFNICCIYSDALQNIFTMEANTLDPDQTAPSGAVWSGSILFTKFQASKVHKQMKEPTTIVVIGGKALKVENLSLIQYQTESNLCLECYSIGLDKQNFWA